MKNQSNSFWLNVVFAGTNLLLATLGAFDFTSVLCLAVGGFCAYSAIREYKSV